MIPQHTPQPFEPTKIIRNETLNEMQKLHQYEIVKWPAYFSDEMCVNMLRMNTDPNVMLFIANNHGITPIVTIGGNKAFIVSFDKRERAKRHLPKYQSLSCNNIEPVEKRLRDQRDSV